MPRLFEHMLSYRERVSTSYAPSFRWSSRNLRFSNAGLAAAGAKMRSGAWKSIRTLPYSSGNGKIFSCFSLLGRRSIRSNQRSQRGPWAAGGGCSCKCSTLWRDNRCRAAWAKVASSAVLRFNFESFTSRQEVFYGWLSRLSRLSRVFLNCSSGLVR